MTLLRSSSAREGLGNINFTSLSGRRRTASFDASNSEPKDVSASIGSENLQGTKTKAGFWHSRLWKINKSKREAKETLPTIHEKETDDNTTSKWKWFLNKIRSKSKVVQKLTSDSVFHSSNQSKNSVTEEQKKASHGIGGESQQKPHSINTNRVTANRRPVTTTLWERRNMRSPPKLDVNNLNATGLKHISRSHQARR
ncbi:hypothetical protein KP509_04G096300 [Ceratopteris richardii]|uniref:Uncharacterized protein n=1 Tax=Ceratopteris richardii TaxID=49495 RepID=A0A8T2V328_CERRI|nr:hypothetical protein KP509_04G096300 [Ceratopteris richardii]